jgi:hypothetical protein
MSGDVNDNRESNDSNNYKVQMPATLALALQRDALEHDLSSSASPQTSHR